MDSLTTTDNEINKNIGLKEFIQAGELLRVALKTPGEGLSKSFKSLDGNTAKSLDKIGAKYKLDDFSEVFDSNVRLSTIHKVTKVIPEQTVTVTTSNNDIKISNVQVVGPDGKVVAEGGNNLKFKPTKPGKYTVKYSYSGIPTSSTTMKILANNKEIDVHTVGSLAYKTKYVADDALPVGTKKVKTQGKQGTVDGNNKTPAVDEVIAVGTQPEIKVTNIPYQTEYKINYSKKKGSPDVILRNGTNGSKTVKTTFTVNENTGEVSRHEDAPVVLNPINEIMEQYKGLETKYVSGGKDIAPSVIQKDFDMKKAIKSFIYIDEDVTDVTKTYHYLPELTTRYIDIRTGKELAPNIVDKKYGEKRDFADYEFNSVSVSNNVKTYTYYKVPKIIQRFFNPNGEKVKPDYTIYNRRIGDVINVGHPWGIDYKGVRLYPILNKLPNEMVEVGESDIIIDYIYDAPKEGEPNVPLKSNLLLKTKWVNDKETPKQSVNLSTRGFSQLSVRKLKR